MGHSSRRINFLAEALVAQSYLEIGVASGDTFRAVAIERKVGVDPAFAFDTSKVASEHIKLISSLSDNFFATEPVDTKFDAIFIDGLHTFEQTLRDFTNCIIRSDHRSVILIDDTVPNDVFSSFPDESATIRHRSAAGINNSSWHGDVYKLIFYIHDFWPCLNYRTITDSGNRQTLVWRSSGQQRSVKFNNLEAISRLTYFDLLDNFDIMQPETEAATLELCISELGKGRPG